ncbi:MAG: T9SS type A sorting domain-containing protein [bacterium]
MSNVLRRSGVEHQVFVLRSTGYSIDGSAPILDFGLCPSLNDSGAVAYVAYESTSSRGRVFLEHQQAILMNYLPPDYMGMSPVVQVNNSNHVIFREFTTDGFFTFIPRVDTESTGPIIVAGSIFAEYWDTPFSYVLDWPSLNNNGMGVACADFRSGGTVLACRDNGIDPHNTSYVLSGFPELWPKISDNNRTVVRFGSDASAQMILFMEPTFDASQAWGLADPSHFSARGKRPGISDDGRMVVFMATEDVDGPAVWVVNMRPDGNPVLFLLDAPTIAAPNLDLPVGVNRIQTDNSEEFYVIYFRDTPSCRELCARRVDISDAMSPVVYPVVVLTQSGGTIEGLDGTVEGMWFYDPVNSRGQVVFWVDMSSGQEAIVRANLADPLRLSRIKPTGEIEYFVRGEDGWGFTNSTASLWNTDCHDRFKYHIAIDPITGVEYMHPQSSFPRRVTSRFFPPWPAFVDAFGAGQCYIQRPDLGRYDYNRLAATRWLIESRGGFGGACFGMAITCYQHFRNMVPNLNSLSTDENLLDGIYAAFARQYGKYQTWHMNHYRQQGPVATFEAIRRMFSRNHEGLRVLSLFWNDGNGTCGHSVNPARIAYDSGATGIDTIFVYDNAIPGNNSVYPIYVRHSPEAWFYPAWNTGWLPDDLYLEDDLVNYDNYVELDTKAGPGYPPSLRDSGSVQIFHPPNITLRAENSAGLSIGHDDTMSFNELAEGGAIIPRTGGVSPPLGLFLPADTYRFEITSIPDSSSFLTVHLDSAYYSYWRSGVDLGQDDLIYDGGLTALNLTRDDKTCSFSSIVARGEVQQQYDIEAVRLSAQDSVSVEFDDSGRMAFRNKGDAKQYDLLVSTSCQTGNHHFQHQAVEIPADAGHLVSCRQFAGEIWSVRLYLDADLNGTYEDSMSLENELANSAPPAENDLDIPSPTRLGLRAYPNPFNPETRIVYELPDTGPVRLDVFDATGRLIAILVRDDQTAGEHVAIWNGQNTRGRTVPAGVYFARLSTAARVEVLKLVMVK